MVQTYLLIISNRQLMWNATLNYLVYLSWMHTYLIFSINCYFGYLLTSAHVLACAKLYHWSFFLFMEDLNLYNFNSWSIPFSVNLFFFFKWSHTCFMLGIDRLTVQYDKMLVAPVIIYMGSNYKWVLLSSLNLLKK